MLTINQKGEIQLLGTELSTHFDEDMIILEKLNPNKPISAIYFDGNKQSYFVKRFLTSDISEGKYSFISDHKDSFLSLVSTDWRPMVEVLYVKEKGKDRKSEIINIEEFISIKGWKALGNKLTNKKIKEVKLLDPLPFTHVEEVNEDQEESEMKIQETIVNTIKEKENVEQKEVKDSKKPNVSDEGAQQITLDL